MSNVRDAKRVFDSYKVLGFRNRKLNPSVDLKEIVRLNGGKIVPVVSVEWLKKWCKENSYRTVVKRQKSMDIMLTTRDLLVAVEKEAKK